MKNSRSFLANLILLACAACGLGSELVARPPFRPVGGMGREPQYRYQDQDRYYQQTDGERHLEMIKVRVEQRKALSDRKAEAEKRRAQLFRVRQFLTDHGADRASFVKAFEELYKKQKATIADGVSYSFDQDDTNQFAGLFFEEDAAFVGAVTAFKQGLDAEKMQLDRVVGEHKAALQGDALGAESRSFRSQELAKAEARLRKLKIYITLLGKAKDKPTLRALLGQQKEIEVADEELARLYEALDVTKDDEDDKVKGEKLKNAAGGEIKSTYGKSKLEKEKQLQKEIEQQEALLKEMENYDKFENVLFRAFLPDEDVSATTIRGKIALALAIPFVTSVRNSLDTEYDKITNRLLRYCGERFHDLMVTVGVASPLHGKKVAAWSRMVASYKKSMDNLAKGSSDSTDVAAAFGAREKPGHTAHAQVPVGTDLAAQVNEEGEVDDVTDFIRHADPVYVRVSSDFVRQMRRQISLVMRRMVGNSYVEQREILSDILKMLDCVGYLATGSFKVYRQTGLTQVLNRDIAACCEWLSAQLAMLKDLINADDADETSSGSTSSSAGKGGRLGVDY